MLPAPSTRILRAADAYGAAVSVVPTEDAERVRQAVAARFTDGRVSYRLWEDVSDVVVERVPDAWRRWMGQYLRRSRT